MKRFYDQELQALRSHLMLMGRKAAEQVKLSVQALRDRDLELAARVRAQDDDLDNLEMEIDAEVIRFISLRAPVAADLRFLVVSMKASHDLERVGDEASNIAKRAKKLEALDFPGASLDEIERMTELALGMLHDVLECYAQGDEAGALAICRRDAEVDQLNKTVYKALTRKMIEEPAFSPAAIELLFVSRAIERIADHATNIAEEIVFLMRSKDIRHSAEAKGDS